MVLFTNTNVGWGIGILLVILIIVYLFYYNKSENKSENKSKNKERMTTIYNNNNVPLKDIRAQGMPMVYQPPPVRVPATVLRNSLPPRQYWPTTKSPPKYLACPQNTIGPVPLPVQLTSDVLNTSDIVCIFAPNYSKDKNEFSCPDNSFIIENNDAPKEDAQPLCAIPAQEMAIYPDDLRFVYDKTTSRYKQICSSDTCFNQYAKFLQ